MYYTIYQTTNLINGKIYIGKHTTTDPHDSYLGSGHGLKIAISKHNKVNFKKTVLFIFETEDEMNDKEIELVNEEFVARGDTYNRTLGGLGSFHHINSNRTEGAFKGKIHTEESKAKMREIQRAVQNLAHNRHRNSENQKAAQNRPEVKLAKRQRTLDRMADPTQKQKHKDGCNTDQFKAMQRVSKIGKKCIYNPVTLETIRVTDPTSYLAKGWILGFIRKNKRSAAVKALEIQE